MSWQFFEREKGGKTPRCFWCLLSVFRKIYMRAGIVAPPRVRDFRWLMAKSINQCSSFLYTSFQEPVLPANFKSTEGGLSRGQLDYRFCLVCSTNPVLFVTQFATQNIALLSAPVQGSDQAANQIHCLLEYCLPHTPTFHSPLKLSACILWPLCVLNPYLNSFVVLCPIRYFFFFVNLQTLTGSSHMSSEMLLFGVDSGNLAM